MTGFGKVTAELPSKKVTVEIKALNSKQLDLSTRIPSIYKDKEMELRSLLLQSLERGKVEFNIFIEYIGKDTPTQINLAAVENYYNQIKEIAEKLNISVPNDWFQTLLRMPDAIKSETVEPDESEWGVVLETVKDAIKHLCDFRIQEGAMLQKLFEQKIANIATLLKEVEKYEGGMLSAQELVLRQITDPQRYLPSYTVREAINAIAGYSKFDYDKVRQPAEANNIKRLMSTGENLSQLLSYLNNNHTFQYEKIRESLGDINPNFTGIGYNIFGNRLYLSLHERNLSHAIDALHISDGTLKYLLLLSIFYNPKRGTLVDIDEPESCLHPDMIRSVAKMMKSAGKTSQIIVATHSALLLNAFELDDILVFEKNDRNETQIIRYSEDDFENREGELLPGQLWLNGEIGGKRW